MKAIDLTCPNCCARMRPASIKNKTITCEYCDSRFIMAGDQLRDWSEEPAEPEIKRTTPQPEENRVEHVTGDVVFDRQRTTTELARIPKRNLWMFLPLALIIYFGFQTNPSSGVVAMLVCYGIYVYFDSRSGRREQRRNYYIERRIPVSNKNVDITFLLCLFFGVIGVHRFYVGKVGTGLLYLFTGGFFTIGWLIDLVKIVMGRFEDNSGGLVL